MTLALDWQQIDALGSIIGGIGTATALLVTLWIVRREAVDRRSADLRRDEERRDEERRQARLVYGAVGKIEEYEGGSELHVDVFNHSDAPVWEVSVRAPGLGHDRPVHIERVNPHSSEANGWRDAPERWALWNLGPGCPGTPQWVDLDVTFVDNTGRRWRRTGRAEPVRLLGGE